MKKIFTLCCCACTVLLNAQTVDEYINSPNDITFEEIGTVSNSLSTPIDLDFHPTRTNELWVLNQGNRNSGGSTVIFYDAGLSTQTSEYRQDGNAWHFMAEATSIAFGDNGDWGTSQGILDANHDGSLFTGPTLWPGDLSIYAMVGIPPTATVNGSHLDMLHQSPYGMGIAHETGNAYWVFDGYNENIVRYDFATPHYPGGFDHDDGALRRYTEIQVSRDPDVPSHMVLDKSRALLYIVDTGNDRIIRLNIYSGDVKGSLSPLYGEVLVEYSEMENAIFEDVVTTGLSAPSGVDYVNNRLLVMDNESLEIIIYDVLTAPLTEVGRIDISDHATNPMGLKIGPDGLIWYVDYSDRTVVRINHPSVGAPDLTSVEDLANETFEFNAFPNPASDFITLEIPENAGTEFNLKMVNSIGQVEMNSRINEINPQIKIDNLTPGLYTLILSNDSQVSTKEILIRR